MISILMPVYNADDYLVDCLESIIQQNCDDWELIAVDDHSTDRSLEILESYRDRDKRISVKRNKGKGIIQALRTAYELARGEMIHRMDADDVMPEHKLSSLRNILIENGKGTIATGKVKYFAEKGVNEGYLNYENWLNQLCDKDSHWTEIYKECVIASPCWMVFKSDLGACGAFDHDVYPEDYDLVFRFYKHGFQVVSASEIMHLWRDHPQRTSRNHVHYAAQAFYGLKLKYFLELEYSPEKDLVVWGAGAKGKRMAKLLKEKNIPFNWACNNPNKFGKDIYDKILYDIREIVEGDVQIIITVAQKNAKNEIRDFMKEKKLVENQDYWFFS